MKELILRSEEKLQKGYNKLITFETPETGYEWFAGVPPHEGLSAYAVF